jgi:hypothetical protein
MSDQRDDTPQVRVSSIVNVVVFAMSLLALSLCLCGVFLSLLPLVANETDLQFGEGVLVSSMICFVPAIILLVTSGGVWLLFGRK